MESNFTLIPEEYKGIISAHTSFTCILQPLERLGLEEPTKEHVIFYTQTHYLVEACNLKTIRVVPYNLVHVVLKIVVHHEFDPLLTCILLLLKNNSVHLLMYDTFKFCHEWKECSDVTSEDIDDCGKSFLYITDIYGERTLISLEELVYLTAGEIDDINAKGKMEAAMAIKQKYLVIPSFDTMKLSSAKNLMNLESTINEGPLYITNNSQKIVHNKWVICIGIMNNSESLICCPELILAVDGKMSFSYEVRILKLVQKGKKNDNSEEETKKDIFIEIPNALVLRPKRKAFMLGICCLPSFRDNPVITCSGTIRYVLKEVDPPKIKNMQEFFGPICFDITEIMKLAINFDALITTEGICTSLLCFIGASYETKLEVKSPNFPLNHFLDKLSSVCKFIRIPGLNHLYYFQPTDSELPFSNAAFFYIPNSLHDISFTLFTRDIDQSFHLSHFIKKILPSDVLWFTEKVNKELDQNKLFMRAKQAVTEVISGIEDFCSDEVVEKCKAVAKETENSRSSFQNANYDLYEKRKQDIGIDSEKYFEWRSRLITSHCDIENLYLNNL